MPFVAFGLAVAIHPLFVDAATVLRWAFAGITIPLVMMYRPAPNFGAGHCLFGLWLLYASCSLLWSPILVDSIPSVFYLGLMFAVFCLNDGNDEAVWRWFRYGAVLSCLVVGAQALGWQGLPQSSAPGGLFMNKNVAAEVAAIALICGPKAKTRVAAILIVAVLLAESRAAYAALAIYLFWEVGAKYRLRICGAVAILALSVVALGPGREWVDMLSPATLGIRLGLWWDALSGFTFFGHGAGSFFSEFPKYNKNLDIVLDRPEHPHNEFVLLAFELGVGALVPLAFFGYIARAGAYSGAVLACVLLLCFGFPFQTPASALMLAYFFGGLARSRDNLLLQYTSRGMGVQTGGGLAGSSRPNYSHAYGREGDQPFQPFLEARPRSVRFPGARRNFGFSGTPSYGAGTWG